MKINKAGLNLIKKYEGCRLTAYKCPAGVHTIGYGHTAGVKMGDKITQERADDLLKEDLYIYEKWVDTINTQYQYNFNRNEFSALVSFTYNCGSGALLSLCAKGKRNKQQIGDCIKLYDKCKGQTLKGLTLRRADETQLYFKGVNKK